MILFWRRFVEFRVVTAYVRWLIITVQKHATTAMQQSLHGNLMLMLQQGASNVDKTQARYNIRTLP